MLRIWFTADDLVRIRLARNPDPMWEILLSLHLLASRDATVLFGAWRRKTLKQVPATVELLPRLTPPRGYSPDFLTPAAGAHGLAAGIDGVLSTPRRRLGAEMSRLAAEQRLPAWAGQLAAGDRPTLTRLGEDLRAYHDLAIAPYWAHIRSRFEADRGIRGGRLLDGGGDRLLSTLHPSTRWQAPVLEVSYGPDRDVHLDGRGLLLVPSFFCWRNPITLLDPALPPVLAYPIEHELGWTNPGFRRRVPPGRALGTLLGRTRAAVLESLAEARTTGEVARRLDISAASASEHATTLRDAGLVATSRDRNRVRHHLTPLGHALLDPASHPGASVAGSPPRQPIRSEPKEAAGCCLPPAR